ncbi:MAG: threonine/serine ThrE exporter family protein [Succiniclasticum sp.]|jgi:uncharacterized membrane protein YjjP (DUF1212 family)
MEETKTVPNAMTKSQVMDIAMDMGRILLKSGAETSRVEDTMMRFCRSHGYYDLNVFCTPTVIILGDESAHGKSRVFRVRWRAVDLGLIMDINNLSYNFKRWGMTYAQAKLWMRERIRLSHPYGNLLVCLASGVGSAAFSTLLGGNWHDFIAAFLSGFAAMGVLKLFNKLHPTAFWENFIAGLVIGFVALLSCKIDPVCTMQNIIVGALMPFLPGLPFTNGVRDYIGGDLLSGNSRIAEAILFALSIAVGLAFAVKIWTWGGLG